MQDERGIEVPGRSPRGGRGLKSSIAKHNNPLSQSLSSRRAWIEIQVSVNVERHFEGSLSSRRAWIEIGLRTDSYSQTFVALLAEGVD